MPIFLDGFGCGPRCDCCLDFAHLARAAAAIRALAAELNLWKELLRRLVFDSTAGAELASAVGTSTSAGAGVSTCTGATGVAEGGANSIPKTSVNSESLMTGAPSARVD